MNKKRWIQKVLTFLLISTLILQPVPLSVMQVTSVISSAEETDGKEKEEQKRKEEEEKRKEEEKKRKEEEEKRKEEEEKKRKEEEEKKRKEEEEKKHKEEAEKKAEEEAKKKAEKEEAEKKAEKEEAEKKAKEEAEKKAAEEAEKKAAEEAEKKAAEEAEKKAKEEAEKKAAEEAEKKAKEEAEKKAAEEAEKKAKEEAEKKAAEEAEKKAKEEAEKKAEKEEKAKKEKTYDLVFEAEHGGKVALSSGSKHDKISKTVKEGKEVRATAYAKDGYKFKKWTKNGHSYSSDAEIEVKASDARYVAWFEKEPEKTEEAKGTGEDIAVRSGAGDEQSSEEADAPSEEKEDDKAASEDAEETEDSEKSEEDGKSEEDSKEDAEAADESEEDMADESDEAVTDETDETDETGEAVAGETDEAGEAVTDEVIQPEESEEAMTDESAVDNTEYEAEEITDETADADATEAAAEEATDEAADADATEAAAEEITDEAADADATEAAAEEATDETADADATEAAAEELTDEAAGTDATDDFAATDIAATEEPAAAATEGPAIDATDAAAIAATEAPAEVAAPVLMPGKTFRSSVAGMTITVVADEGTFPEGTQMRTTYVNPGSVMGAIEGAVEGEIKKVKAVDITFRYKEQEIQPEKAVKVTISASGMDSSLDHEILHIDDHKKNVVETVVDKGDMPGTKGTFHVDGFSIYAVVETGETGEDARLAVNFVKADGSTATQLINQRQIGQIGQYIFDPGVGTLPADTEFMGWSSQEDYSAETDRMTISDIREEVKAKLNAGVKEGDEVTYYAMVFKSYTVTYLDERSIHVKTAQILVRADDTSDVTHEVSLNYTPYPPEDEGAAAEFLGWQQIEPEAPGETKLYQVGDTLDLDETEYVLKAYTQNGHWLIYEENLTNAPYTQPEFVPIGGTPTEPAAPTRSGYTFDGWYTGDESDARDGQVSGELFDFSKELTGNTTVYGKWTKGGTADYSVMIWFQNKQGTGYDYSGITITVEDATVGSDTYQIRHIGGGNTGYARIFTSPTSYQNAVFEGFHLSNDKGTSGQGYDSPVPVAAEGNTVVHVYFDRSTITYNFHYDNLPDKSFSGLYQSEFTEWPDPGDGRVWTTRRYRFPLPLTVFDPDSVDPGSGSYDFTFTLTNYATNHMLYVYKMTETGEWKYTDDYLVATARIAGGSTGGCGGGGCGGSTWLPTEEYFGYELDAYQKMGTSGTWTKADPSQGITINSDLYLRYSRKQYDIVYNDGIFVDGNGAQVEDAPAARTAFQTEKDIYYEADISDKGFKPTISGFTFLGWYDNEACAGNTYTFDKMPANNVTLYAKWGRNEYEVEFFPNDSPEDPIVYSDGTSHKYPIYADEGDRVGNPGGERNNYDLVGWYADEALKRPFDFDAIVINKTNIAKYGKLFDDSEVSHDFLTTIGCLHLYAKWRSKLIGAEGINVEYDANGGTDAPTDGSYYVDQAEAVAQGASTPEDPKTLVFSHWEVQKWNGSDYEPSGVKVYPGETFEVIADDAKITDKDGNVVPKEDLVKTEEYTYTIQLKAQYIERDREVKTHICWFRNDGTAAFRKDENLKINQSVDVPDAPSRDDADFIGWAKVDIGDTEEEAKEWEENSSNWTQDLSDANLVTYKDGKYSHSHVAADENHPYQAAFAVWEEKEAVVTVHHYLKGTTTQVKEDDTETCKIGDKYTAAPATTYQDTDLHVDVDSYDPAKEITVEKGENVITIYYVLELTIITEKLYKNYDGEPLTGEYSIDGALEDDLAAIEAALPEPPSVTDAFTSKPFEPPYAYPTDEEQKEIIAAVPGYYDVIFEVGSLYIYPRLLTITAADSWKPYGTEDPEFADAVYSDEQPVEGELDMLDLTVTRTNDAEEVGTYEEVLTIGKTVAELEAEYTNYLFAIEPGNFKITPMEITVKAKDGKKVYDGKALKAEDTGYEITEGSLAEGETAEAALSGEQTLVGSSPAKVGEVTISRDGTDTTKNYKITKVDGTLTVTDGTDPEEEEEIDDGLVVTKTVDDRSYSLGETVTFKITATNIYDEAKDITLTEIDGVTLETDKFSSVEPGATVETTASYEIKEEDILAGSFTNTVTAEVGNITKQATATAGTAAKNGHLTVEKVTTSTAPEGGYTVGSTIKYKITVVNDGNLTITDITVTDELTGDEWKVESLAPGSSKDFTTSYTVTEADAEAGAVVNVAAATGTSPDPDKPEVPVEDGTVTDNVVPPEPEPVTYSITYKLNGGKYEGYTDDIVEKYPSGTVIEIHAAPIRDGYNFDYWEGSKYDPGDSYIVTEDHVFTAQWTLSPPKPAPIPTPDPKPVPVPGDHSKDSKSSHSSGGSHHSKSPKTGDDSNAAMWIVILLAAAAGAGAVIYRKKKNSK